MKYLLLLLLATGCGGVDQESYKRGYQIGYEHGYESASNKYYFYACYLQKNGYDINKTHKECDYAESAFVKMLDKNVMVYKRTTKTAKELMFWKHNQEMIHQDILAESRATTFIMRQDEDKEVISLLNMKNRTKSQDKKLSDFLASNLTNKVRMDKILNQVWGNKQDEREK